VVPDPDELDVAIASEVARLDELDRLRGEVQERTERLRADRDRSPAVRPIGELEWTAARKLAVFAGLFRGRQDLFPVRWEKRDKSRSGWSPSCRNEWKDGVCAKPAVKCGECPNQAFPAPDQGELLGPSAASVVAPYADARLLVLYVLDADAVRE
jgi:hypothetical protein